MTALSPEAEAAVDKVQKLLRLAANNSNEHESAQATARAMELLAAHNLDMAAVERDGGTTGKRAEENLRGGRYEWERSLWSAVATLNFCLYWSQTSFVEDPKGKVRRYIRDPEHYKATGNSHRHVRGRTEHEHRLVGRTVNVAATKAMAGYLQSAVDRLTRERCEPRGIPLRSKWANAFRQGVTDRLEGKVYERRRHLLREEEQKRRDAEAAAVAAGRSGVSTGTEITLTTYVSAEHDANIDFVYGAGTSASWAADRAKKAAAERAADEAYTKWAAANPEAARKAEEKRRAESLKRDEKRAKKNTRVTNDLGAYYAGRDAAEGVSIDPQAQGFQPAGLL